MSRTIAARIRSALSTIRLWVDHAARSLRGIRDAPRHDTQIQGMPSLRKKTQGTLERLETCTCQAGSRNGCAMQHQEQATMHGKPRKKRRVFLWVFLAIQVIFLVWLIVGISSVAHSHDCTGLTPAECTSAKQVGGTIGAGLVVALWVATDVILGIGRFIVLTARHNRGNQ